MKKECYRELPENYGLHLDLRLAEDRKSLTVLLVTQLAAIAVMAAAGFLVCPVSRAFDMNHWHVAAGLGIMSIGLLVYIVAHEWVHGLAIRYITGRRADFGIDLKKGMAYAGSDAYFGKTPYIIIALAPVVFWGIVLAAVLHGIPEEWFWYIYVIQIMNVSGSVGDFYVTWLTFRAPEGTIIRDYGTSMKFYTKTTQE